jgi:hypothetical protein
MEPASKSNTGNEDLCSQERRRFSAGPTRCLPHLRFFYLSSTGEPAGHLESVDVRRCCQVVMLVMLVMLIKARTQYSFPRGPPHASDSMLLRNGRHKRWTGTSSIFPRPYGTLQAAWYTRGIVPIQSISAVIVLESRRRHDLKDDDSTSSLSLQGNS